MSVTKWSFRGTPFETNPAEAEGWVKEEKVAEVDLIDSHTTVIQSSGFKSEAIVIEGWILSESFLNTFRGWQGLQGTLSDDFGNSCTARLMSFEPKRVRNVANWHTYTYTARFMKR